MKIIKNVLNVLLCATAVAVIVLIAVGLILQNRELVSNATILALPLAIWNLARIWRERKRKCEQNKKD